MTSAHGQHPKTTWWQLTLPVPQRWAEDASACLIEAGALGVQTLGDSSEPMPRFATQGLLPQAPATSLTGHVLLLASYAATLEPQAIKQGACDALENLQLTVDRTSLQLAQRDDGAWAERWKQYFKPLKVGRRIWVVPSWEDQFVAPARTVVLELDPGMAFGTGQHATTAMCLKALEWHAERLLVPPRPGVSVCDLGCGSGILAIAAAKLGFGPVTAVDLDPLAVAATQDNAQKNNVPIKATTTPIEQISETYSLLVANILAQPLIDLAPAIAGRLKPGGVLLVSGILTSQADEVQRAFEHTGVLLHRNRWTQGEWSALGFSRLGKR